MTALFLLAFCRVVLGLAFLISSVGKLRCLGVFRQTIVTFHLLPGQFSEIAACFVLVSELGVIVGIVVGGVFLLPTFVLTALLLLLFSGAMASVLMRRMYISCYCFGKREKTISGADLWRNAGFLVCALAGCAFLFWSQPEQGDLTLAAWLLAGGQRSPSWSSACL